MQYISRSIVDTRALFRESNRERNMLKSCRAPYFSVVYYFHATLDIFKLPGDTF